MSSTTRPIRMSVCDSLPAHHPAIFLYFLVFTHLPTCPLNLPLSCNPVYFPSPPFSACYQQGMRVIDLCFCFSPPFRLISSCPLPKFCIFVPVNCYAWLWFCFPCRWKEEPIILFQFMLARVCMCVSMYICWKISYVSLDGQEKMEGKEKGGVLVCFRCRVKKNPFPTSLSFQILHERHERVLRHKPLDITIERWMRKWLCRNCHFLPPLYLRNSKASAKAVTIGAQHLWE